MMLMLILNFFPNLCILILENGNVFPLKKKFNSLFTIYAFFKHKSKCLCNHAKIIEFYALCFAKITLKLNFCPTNRQKRGQKQYCKSFLNLRSKVLLNEGEKEFYLTSLFSSCFSQPLTVNKSEHSGTFKNYNKEKNRACHNKPSNIFLFPLYLSHMFSNR